MVRLIDYRREVAKKTVQNQEITRLEQELAKMRKMISEKSKTSKKDNQIKSKTKNNKKPNKKTNKKNIKKKTNKKINNKKTNNKNKRTNNKNKKTNNKNKRTNNKNKKTNNKNKRTNKRINNKNKKNLESLVTISVAGPTVQHEKDQALIAETRSQIKLSKDTLNKFTPPIKRNQSAVQSRLKQAPRLRPRGTMTDRKVLAARKRKQDLIRGVRRPKKYPCPYCPGG